MDNGEIDVHLTNYFDNQQLEKARLLFVAANCGVGCVFVQRCDNPIGAGVESDDMEVDEDDNDNDNDNDNNDNDNDNDNDGDDGEDDPMGFDDNALDWLNAKDFGDQDLHPNASPAAIRSAMFNINGGPPAALTRALRVAQYHKEYRSAKG
ncbi:uncharacterized protein LAESUDRAFT_713170 [Laetiporus sulphureus 93-53]|uniref:Uncharacterized protein n=1 Tax=Laetiporus sulphureus 93-53 TaxID=1314785 RepID=A0A165EV16_9APHY|nr:uncharacterized protein LAESUDRAFT_713170 [Laetiporus sulphureus 93-53]KZT07819.1 hypothetical protein LAESUDRAFT_713170 [Laetiporus sulphureus 93-53]